MEIMPFLMHILSRLYLCKVKKRVYSRRHQLDESRHNFLYYN